MPSAAARPAQAGCLGDDQRRAAAHLPPDPRTRGRSSATTIYDTCREWLRLARWLHERGITDIAACTGDEWRDYAAGRVNKVSRDHAVKILGQLTDLWAFDQLTACPSGITRPPWESEGADGYLLAAPDPDLPEHPAYRQILDAFAELRRPLRARDHCTALDLPIAAKNTEGIRSKLKRLVSRGILIETEPGSLTGAGA